MTHLPALWRFRLLAAIHARGTWQNRRLLNAWARAEGGNAGYNPLNSTTWWPGATDYNSIPVRNYPSGAAGIAATAATLSNGFYNGIVADLRKGEQTAEMIVRRNAHEFDVWGTGAANLLRVLGSHW